MLKKIYAATQPNGSRCGFSTETALNDYLADHPDAADESAVEVTAQQLAEWKSTGSWSDDCERNQFIAAGSLPRYGVDVRGFQPPENEHFALIWNAALAADNRDAYASDMAVCTIWGDPPVVGTTTERLAYLTNLWNAAHMSIRDICTEAHITMAALSARTTIPYRTLQNWASGTNRFPGYDRLLILHYLGLMPTL